MENSCICNLIRSLVPGEYWIEEFRDETDNTLLGVTLIGVKDVTSAVATLNSNDFKVTGTYSDRIIIDL